MQFADCLSGRGGGNCIRPDSRRRTGAAPILLSVSPCWKLCRSMLISRSRRNLAHRRRKDSLTIFLNRWEYTPVEECPYEVQRSFCTKADEPFRSSRRLSVADGWREFQAIQETARRVMTSFRLGIASETGCKGRYAGQPANTLPVHPLRL